MIQNDFEIYNAIESMCRMFWGPDLESCKQMKQGIFFNSWEAVLKASGLDSFAAMDSIKSIINQFDTEQALFDHLNECYVRLFVNTREGIAAPLYQSCYEFENAPMMGASAVKMKNLFDLKGLSLENRVHEPPDHLAIELEYLFFILQEDGSDQNEIAAFAEQIMLPWIKIFSQRLEPAMDKCRFYYSASEVLIHIIKIIGKSNTENKKKGQPCWRR